MNPTELRKTLIEAIENWEDHSFDELARAIYAHQYTHNSAYRTFCNNRGVLPDTLESIDQIPAVPTDAFKLVDLFIDTDPTHTFLTSGTTTESRGAHHFFTLAAYRASLHPTFTHFCNPAEEPLRMLVLAPTFEDLPESSLSFMLSEVVERWGDDESQFFVTVEDGRWKVDFPAIRRALDQACHDQATTMVLGTAFAFAEFFDDLPDDTTWTLPPGSRLMETGGFKGRTKEISRDELYAQFTKILGLARASCIGEYSMTELSSQTYTKDDSFRFHAPPWLKIQIVDPIKLTPHDRPGRVGLIRFVDLANIDSVMAVQTSDRGVLHDDGGLQLLGRAPDSELRGCSLTIEEIVGARTSPSA